jgi:hypothetical protein
MAHLNTLAFVSVPKHPALSPTQIRRNRLIERLQEQKRLAADPAYAPVVKRWKKAADGSKILQDHYRRLKPWWRTDVNGNVVLTIKVGMRTLELEKGKAGIAVGDLERLGSVFDTLIAATVAGELDPLLASARVVEARAVLKAKKAV